ncbi:threonine synthase [Geodermatophilus obscurus]|jgi:threonine synthase|uniref:Threonine synthase n=1 Tax=Geodermatophilus obscurus (strain ATCC 25078 / DSM 43160 / JCM 3152 / CCUG 61914 / KCC A-0152 / KCTC 9177 / NBRC 13315 / NRRL B-3577 / G-20) TaxID=526225 RepID=D2SES9_GEOOG|nr:threonine synthase [Geodermatophilus obscurus]ADB76715.1 threonine synthase [Geodermatophilus obscurus DSM 43160]
MTTQLPVRGTVSPLWPGLIEAYRSRLPVSDSTPVVTLQEGATPLVPAQELSRRTGCDVYLKVEGANPTGSFKDRGMTMAITKAREEGAQAVICASTGNTSASAAAYAARAGMVCAVLVPQGKIALGKLAQALVHGAKLLQVDGNFDDCLALASKLAIDYPVSLVNSVNQFRIEGQKTASFEIVDVLGDAPDVHCLPVGNAGNITAYWQGYREYAADGTATRTPRMWGFQAAGAAPIVTGQVVEQPQTIATAIRIGNPASWTKALAARDESGGRIDAVTDRAILAAYRLLARTEAVFVEPASAASVAGLLQVAEAGGLEPGQRVVCTVTGNGLKDPEWAISGAPAPVTVPVDAAAAAAQLGL